MSFLFENGSIVTCLGSSPETSRLYIGAAISANVPSYGDWILGPELRDGYFLGPGELQISFVLLVWNIFKSTISYDESLLLIRKGYKNHFGIQ